eukprot:4260272-Amphidinium_carterae.1
MSAPRGRWKSSNSEQAACRTEGATAESNNGSCAGAAAGCSEKERRGQLYFWFEACSFEDQPVFEVALGIVEQLVHPRGSMPRCVRPAEQKGRWKPSEAAELEATSSKEPELDGVWENAPEEPESLRAAQEPDSLRVENEDDADDRDHVGECEADVEVSLHVLNFGVGRRQGRQR